MLYFEVIILKQNVFNADLFSLHFLQTMWYKSNCKTYLNMNEFDKMYQKNRSYIVIVFFLNQSSPSGCAFMFEIRKSMPWYLKVFGILFMNLMLFVNLNELEWERQESQGRNKKTWSTLEFCSPFLFQSSKFFCPLSDWNKEDDMIVVFRWNSFY